jgi:hypothetical protein
MGFDSDAGLAVGTVVYLSTSQMLQSSMRISFVAVRWIRRSSS